MSSVKVIAVGRRMPDSRGLLKRVALMGGIALLLSGCATVPNFDWDLRPTNRFSTSAAARQATAARPAPDARGIISYPGYQVVVAGRGEIVSDIAQRLGLPPADLARLNAVEPSTVMRGGELLVLPGRAGAAGVGSITTAPLLEAAPAAGNTRCRRGRIIGVGHQFAAWREAGPDTIIGKLRDHDGMSHRAQHMDGAADAIDDLHRCPGRGEARIRATDLDHQAF